MFKIKVGFNVFLDFIRGFASQVVLLGHSFSFFSVKYFEFHFFIQDYAIVVFFFLSGFLIVYSIMVKVSSGIYTFKQFLWLRFIRIYSVLVPSLLFVFLVDYWLINHNTDYTYVDSFNFGSFFSSLFLLTSFDSIVYFITGYQNTLSPFGTVRPIWTLSIEWVIYLFVGLTASIIYVRNSSKFTLLVKILLVAVFSLVPVLHLVSTKLTLAWVLGGFSVFIFNSDKCMKWFNFSYFNYVVIACSGVLLGFCSVVYGPFNLFSVIFFSTMLFALFAKFANYQFSSSFSKLSKFLAFYSFSLYLTHYTILEFVKSLAIGEVYLNVFISFIISNCFAMVFAYLFERKLYNKLRFGV